MLLSRFENQEVMFNTSLTNAHPYFLSFFVIDKFCNMCNLQFVTGKCMIKNGYPKFKTDYVYRVSVSWGSNVTTYMPVKMICLDTHNCPFSGLYKPNTSGATRHVEFSLDCLATSHAAAQQTSDPFSQPCLCPRRAVRLLRGPILVADCQFGMGHDRNHPFVSGWSKHILEWL